jgi:hypothetical protein
VSPSTAARASTTCACHEQPAAQDRELLEAVEMLLHWSVIRIEQNMGGLWFSNDHMGTRPLDAAEIRRLYDEEAKSRGWK